MIGLLSKFRSNYSALSFNVKSMVTYKIEMNFRTLTLAMYKDSQNNNRIARFYSNTWEKQISTEIVEESPIRLKTFINTSTLIQSGQLKMCIIIDDEIVSEKTFILNKGDQFSGWLELAYVV